ncbi:MAG TPA: pyridoxamine 5'-phosphate oxidase family protein [Paucimonas sp.]|nr:pyridoxamine 5'-phosphate oxidase family protein [Paucimonas sp.]
MFASLPVAWPHAESPFHDASRQVQARLGVEIQADRHGRGTIRPWLPEQHRSFFASLPFVLVGNVDANGQPWASLLTGKPGFLTSPTPTTLCITARPSLGRGSLGG